MKHQFAQTLGYLVDAADILDDLTNGFFVLTGCAEDFSHRVFNFLRGGGGLLGQTFDFGSHNRGESFTGAAGADCLGVDLTGYLFCFQSQLGDTGDNPAHFTGRSSQFAGGVGGVAGGVVGAAHDLVTLSRILGHFVEGIEHALQGMSNRIDGQAHLVGATGNGIHVHRHLVHRSVDVVEINRRRVGAAGVAVPVHGLDRGADRFLTGRLLIQFDFLGSRDSGPCLWAGGVLSRGSRFGRAETGQAQSTQQ